MKKLTIAALLLLSSIFSVSQEKLTPEEIFRWVPAQNISDISFANYEIARTLPGLKKYLDHNKRCGRNIPFWVDEPFRFKDQALSRLFVVANGKSVTAKFAENLEGEDPSSDHALESLGFDDYSLLQVIRYPLDLNLGGLIRKNTEFSKTDYSFNDLQVYFYQSKKQPGPPSRYFCVTSENVIIVSEKLKMLRIMIDTGHGMVPSFLEEFAFPDALDLLSELGQEWGMRDDSIGNRALYEKINEDNIDGGFLDIYASRLEKSYLSIDSIDFRDDPKSMTIRFFQNEKNARDDYANISRYLKTTDSYYKPGGLAHFGKINKKAELKGKYTIQTLVMNSKYMERFEELWAERLAESEKLRAKKEKQKSEEK